MALDNLQELTEYKNTVLNPNGGFASVKVVNHNELENRIITKLGRYVGFPFLAKRTIEGGVILNGYIYWEGKSLNASGDFDLITSTKTIDSNSFLQIISTASEGDLLHIKDFHGRSIILTYKSSEQIIDGDSKYIILSVTGDVNNPNYTYLDTDPSEPCLLEIIKKSSPTPFFRGNLIWEKKPSNNTNSIITGERVTGFWTDTYWFVGSYVSGDPTLLESYDISEYIDFEE